MWTDDGYLMSLKGSTHPACIELTFENLLFSVGCRFECRQDEEGEFDALLIRPN